MQYSSVSRQVLLLTFLTLGTIAISGTFSPVQAATQTQCRLGVLPIYGQEGSTITIVLNVGSATPLTPYEFDFLVRDPSTTVWTSNHQHYNTSLGQTEFNLIILFPSPEFPNGASTSLVGTYVIAVNQITPPRSPTTCASYFFFIGLTDKGTYQRTEMVSIIGTKYSSGESVRVDITTSVTSTLVYRNTVIASTSGQVSDAWRIPKNATVTEGYVVTLTGTTTSKNPADAQGFNVIPASMSISSLSSTKSSYQRTETFSFSFQSVYPSGETANTGLGLVTLTRPDRTNLTLTTNYNSTTQMFVANYKTSATSQNGTWTASLVDNGYDDGFGNTGPATTLVNSPDLVPALLTISITMKNSFAAYELIRFNATIQYPDGTILQTGNVSSTISFSGGGYTAPVPVIFDTTLNLWVGSYNPRGDEPSGLWSLTVTASDSALPANNGSAVKTFQIQNRPPTAAFTSSATSTQTQVSIAFNASGSSDPDGTIVAYLWDFGDGSTGSGVITSHSYASAGTYTVRINVTDNSGSGSSTTLTLTIQNRPPVAIITGSTSSTVGVSTTFDATTSSDPDGTVVAYLWDFGDGSTGSGVTTTHSYSDPGTYTVRLTVTDNTGSASSSTTFTITVAPSQSSGNVSFPLFYFGILAAAIAGTLLAVFMFFRKHKVTHARLKIDLEAVKTEAGRIENQEFFQSIKDQLRKDKDD